MGPHLCKRKGLPPGNNSKNKHSAVREKIHSLLVSAKDEQ